MNKVFLFFNDMNYIYIYEFSRKVKSDEPPTEHLLMTKSGNLYDSSATLLKHITGLRSVIPLG